MTDGRASNLDPDLIETIRQRLVRELSTDVTALPTGPRGQSKLAQNIAEHLDTLVAQHAWPSPPVDQQRAIISDVLEELHERADDQTGIASDDIEAPEPSSRSVKVADRRSRSQERIQAIKARLQPLLMDRINVSVAAGMSSEALEADIRDTIGELLTEIGAQVNGSELARLVQSLVSDMKGFGPIESLLADDTVTDILINGPRSVYVERAGKLELSDVVFRDNDHLMNVARRIVSWVGRRVDETNPLVDARLPDGSRVNAIIPPLAIDGASLSIRKFAKRKITLDVMVRQGNLSEEMAALLRIAARSRLNILISGGTGSGKTTLLNAMSRMIHAGERVITIEDAAELQLQQPHVVRLETRPANIEGEGEVTIRDLLRNALRMRPDRIILGEIRGHEALDMLQAMNTGHDGSMSTLHANNPREALSRLENMIAMSGFSLPTSAMRRQIASAVNLIIQVSRMRDGVRRVTNISEIVGMEGDIITLQTLFEFEYAGDGSGGRIAGQFISSNVKPHFHHRAEYHNLGNALMDAMQSRGFA